LWKGGWGERSSEMGALLSPSGRSSPIYYSLPPTGKISDPSGVLENLPGGERSSEMGDVRGG